MKKIFFLVMICCSLKGMAQTETFDMVTYNAPKNWKKDIKQGVVFYTNVNAVTGGYCVIGIYAGTPGNGDAQKDFEKEWKDLAVTPYKADPNAKPEIETTADGWKQLTAASKIIQENVDALVILSVFSGFGKTTSILANLNDQSYLPLIDSLLANIKLDKTAKIAVPVLSTTNLSVVGTWSDYSGAFGNYVNAAGGFIGSADAHEMHQYIFNADKKFAYKYLGSSANNTLYIESSGSYSIKADNLTLNTKIFKSKMGNNPAGTMKEDKTKEIADSYKYYIGPNKWEAGPFLNLHKDGNYYPWSDYQYDYYKQIIGVDTKIVLPNSATTKDEPVKNNAVTEKTGHMQFTPMKGWTVKKFSNAITFTPNDISSGQYLEVRIMEPKPFTGTMQQALAETWNDVLKDLDATTTSGGNPYNIEAEKESYKGWDYIRARGSFYAAGNETNLYDIRLFIVQINNRIERIAVWGLMNIDHKTYSPWANPLYQKAIEEFFYTIKFDDWKEQEFTIPLLQGDGITGLYGGLKLGDGTLNASYTLFFPNGQVFNGPKFPLQGFYGLNTWVEAELRTKYWGTYTMQNGKGNIKMGYGNIPIKISGNDIIVTTQNTDHKYEKILSVDDAIFNGTYAFDGKWNGDPPSITFTAYGKFIDKGALNILNHQTMDPFNITKEPGGGTYTVKDFTLVCNYSDGRKVQLVFTGEGYSKKNISPATLTFSFNNDVLYKK